MATIIAMNAPRGRSTPPSSAACTAWAWPGLWTSPPSGRSGRAKGSRPMSCGRLRRKAKTTTPMTAASAASQRNAVDSELAWMMRAAMGETMSEAMPLPAEAIPTAVPTWSWNHRPTSVVMHTMPPRPYPEPVNTAPRQKSATLRACEYSAKPTAVSSVATSTPRRQSRCM